MTSRLRKIASTFLLSTVTAFWLAATTQAALVAYFDFEDNEANTTTDNVGDYVGTLEGDATIGAGI